MKITEKGAVLNTREKETVIGITHATDKKQKLTPGKEYKVHPLTAENLVNTGHAKYKDEKKQKAFEAEQKKAGKGSKPETDPNI